VKPKFRDLFKKFSPHTWPAMKVGFSQLFYQLSLAVPGIVLRKFLGMSCESEEMFIDIVAAFNCQIRYYQIVFCVAAAVSMGFLPCASYAAGAERYGRVLRLLIHASWIGIVWCGLMMILTCAVPRELSKAFSQSDGYLGWAEKLLRNSNVLSVLCPVALVGQAVLQALQLGSRASIVSIGTQLLPLPLFSVILYYTNKSDPARLLYSYPLQQACGVLLAVPLAVGPIRDVIQKARVEKGRPAVGNSSAKEEMEEILTTDGEMEENLNRAEA
jgi:Na+-driven multidrug efflux pump